MFLKYEKLNNFVYYNTPYRPAYLVFLLAVSHDDGKQCILIYSLMVVFSQCDVTLIIPCSDVP